MTNKIIKLVRIRFRLIKLKKRKMFSFKMMRSEIRFRYNKEMKRQRKL